MKRYKTIVIVGLLCCFTRTWGEGTHQTLEQRPVEVEKDPVVTKEDQDKIRLECKDSSVFDGPLAAFQAPRYINCKEECAQAVNPTLSPAACLRKCERLNDAAYNACICILQASRLTAKLKSAYGFFARGRALLEVSLDVAAKNKIAVCNQQFANEVLAIWGLQ